jgi:hypothetical protein
MNEVSKGLDMKQDLEKIVSIGGWALRAHHALILLLL